MNSDQIFNGYYNAMKLSYPADQTAHAVAREVRDIFLAHISTLESELQQVREERDGMREAMEPAFVILEGLRLSVKWELTPDIVQEIERVCPLVMAALAPAPAARTDGE